MTDQKSTQPSSKPSVVKPAVPPPGGDDANPAMPASGSNEAPDRDTPAWEGTEPEDAVGLVDPRHEIPNPPGL